MDALGPVAEDANVELHLWLVGGGREREGMPLGLGDGGDADESVLAHVVGGAPGDPLRDAEANEVGGHDLEHRRAAREEAPEATDEEINGPEDAGRPGVGLELLVVEGAEDVVGDEDVVGVDEQLEASATQRLQRGEEDDEEAEA